MNFTSARATAGTATPRFVAGGELPRVHGAQGFLIQQRYGLDDAGPRDPAITIDQEIHDDSSFDSLDRGLGRKRGLGCRNSRGGTS